MSHKGVCATKDQPRESLIDGSKKVQPMFKIKPTAKNLEIEHHSLRLSIDFGMSKLGKPQNAILSKHFELHSQLQPRENATSPIHTLPGVSHQGSKGETNSTILIGALYPLACFHVLDRRSFELMNMSLKNMPDLNLERP
jgi:hypothetical protein